MSTKETLQALRAALQFSPDNVPLRQHLADTLLGLGQFEEAETEYRLALAIAPSTHQLKFGLARAFYQQGKNAQAVVIVEDLLKSSENRASVYLLYTRILLSTGEVGLAAQQYSKAVEADPAVNDPELAERLGFVLRDGLQNAGSDRNFLEDTASPLETSHEKPTITFKDVGGMETIKEEIRLKIIYPLTNPEIYQAYGKSIGGGVLLYGPPGCGKTYLARATAGEIQSKFISIGINDVLDMWIGNSEKNLHEIFQEARRDRPCVLFFDEVDALAAKRTDMRQAGNRQIINQFLAELDGSQTSNEGILILAATNGPWFLDSAFRRPGRFDRILFVPPPDLQARGVILRLLCRGKPIQDIDFDYLSKKTEHFSGADLKAVLDVAVEKKLQEAMKQGIPKPLTTKDLAAAADTIKPSAQEWFATARNYALYSNQGGVYDDILKYLKL
ncbi:AAA family ATPase [Phormidium nigroviride]